LMSKINFQGVFQEFQEQCEPCVIDTLYRHILRYYTSHHKKKILSIFLQMTIEINMLELMTLAAES
jgi:hypothetical protein